MAQEEGLSAQFSPSRNLWAAQVCVQTDEAPMDRSMSDLPKEAARTGGQGDNQDLQPGTFPKPGEGAISIQLKEPACPEGVYSFQLRSQLKYQSATGTLLQRRLLFRQTCRCFFSKTTQTALQKEASGLLHTEVLQSYLKERCFSGHPSNLLSDTSLPCFMDFSAKERLTHELRFLAVPL